MLQCAAPRDGHDQDEGRHGGHGGDRGGHGETEPAQAGAQPTLLSPGPGRQTQER